MGRTWTGVALIGLGTYVSVDATTSVCGTNTLGAVIAGQSCGQAWTKFGFGLGMIGSGVLLATIFSECTSRTEHDHRADAGRGPGRCVVRILLFGSCAAPSCPSPFFRDGGSLLSRQLLRTGLAALEAPEAPERDGGGVLPLRLLDDGLDGSERRLVRIVDDAYSVWHARRVPYRPRVTTIQT